MDSAVSQRGLRDAIANAKWFRIGFWIATLALSAFILRPYFENWRDNVSRENSYYTHAFLVPFICLFFTWRMRNELARIPRGSSNWGYAVLGCACLMVLGGDLLGLRMLGEAAIIPLLAGFVLIFLGAGHLRRLWFPLAFLLFMIPLPEFLTTSITFRVKMLAMDCAIFLSRACLLPMIRDGSYVRFGDDQLLIGDVCGGLRSLIALLALGAMMSYMSQTRPCARVLTLLVSVPVAVFSNVLRIFFLCVVASFWGSEVASGWVHDISGLFIYVVALLLLFGFDRLLHRLAPSKPHTSAQASS
ncbi:MAG: exosortase/archaeosortase family protein [Candidatus Hydrogenedentes bacterium]|nr:exosortase/archaeosortase family protein [Candidatus Hydrogenedentota bacterium]